MLELIPCSSLISPLSLPRHAQRCRKLAWQRSLCLHIQNDSCELKETLPALLAKPGGRCKSPLRNAAAQLAAGTLRDKSKSYFRNYAPVHWPIDDHHAPTEMQAASIYARHASVAAKLAECRKWGTQERCAKVDWKSKSSV